MVRRGWFRFSLLTIIFPIIVALGLVLVVVTISKTRELRSKATIIGPTLALTPATFTGEIGQAHTVAITLDTANDTVSAMQLHLTYDTNTVQVSSFAPASIFPVVLQAASIGNGNLTVTLGTTGTSPFHGADIVGSFTVKILKAGKSKILFSDDTQVASLGKSTNSLAGAAGMTVTTGQNSTQTPTLPLHQQLSVSPLPTKIISQPPSTQAPSKYGSIPTQTPTPVKVSASTPTPATVQQTFGDLVPLQRQEPVQPQVTIIQTEQTSTQQIPSASPESLPLLLRIIQTLIQLFTKKP